MQPCMGCRKLERVLQLCIMVDYHIFAGYRFRYPIFFFFFFFFKSIVESVRVNANNNIIMKALCNHAAAPIKGVGIHYALGSAAVERVHAQCLQKFSTDLHRSQKVPNMPCEGFLFLLIIFSIYTVEFSRLY